MRDMVIVISYDGAASRTVARKLRAEKVYCKILPAHTLAEEALSQQPMGLVLAGATRGEAPAVPEAYARFPLPVLALGDAAVGLCEKLDGTAGDIVADHVVVPISLDSTELFEGVDSGERMLALARALTLPDALRPIATAMGATVGFRAADRPVYGLQFQTEPNDPDSTQILVNFATSICGCTQWWDNEAFIDRAAQEIRRIAGDGTALCAVSGGVDSGVCAVLTQRAIGDRLRCNFIDTGLMRAGEPEDVMRFYGEQGMRVSRVDASSRVLSALAGVRDGQEKQRIIAGILRDVLNEEKEKYLDACVIIKGTNFSDLSLSPDDPDASAASQSIVLEPLRELFKDEVRRVGEYLGLPQNFYQRQPFPGTGLALRIMGRVTADRLYVLRRADDIFRQEIEAAGQEKRLWQYFAVLSSMPDEEGVVVCLRAVHTSDGTDAHAARVAYDLLERATQRMLNELPNVRRVVYDMTPGTHDSGIEWQ